MAHSKEAHYQTLLDKKLKQGRYKQLKYVLPTNNPLANSDSLPLLNFSSNDFLGLAQHPFVKKNTIKYVLKWGAGSSASRLVSSHLEQQAALERHLAHLMAKPTAFFLNPLQNIHELTLSPLAIKEATILVDEQVADPIKIALKKSPAKTLYFHHNSIKHLTSLLENVANEEAPCWIVTESIFHHQGDRAPIGEIASLAKSFNALLYVDDSLSFMAMGHRGFGLAAPRKGVDMAISAFGKASGSFGSFVVTSETLKSFLMHLSPELSSSTLLPPAALGAIEAILELIPDMQEERKRIAQIGQVIFEELNIDGIVPKGCDTHIIPLHFESDKDLYHFSHHLVEQRILAQNLKTSGLTQEPTARIIINALHTNERVYELMERMQRWKRPLNYEPAFA